MTYFCPCFVCGSEESECGHREHELLIWWRNAMKSAKAELSIEGMTQLLPQPVRIETLREVFTSAPKNPFKPAATHPWRDPPKLERGRMKWPEIAVTPDLALSQRKV